jgi:hypothetical protein
MPRISVEVLKPLLELNLKVDHAPSSPSGPTLPKVSDPILVFAVDSIRAHLHHSLLWAAHSTDVHALFLPSQFFLLPLYYSGSSDRASSAVVRRFRWRDNLGSYLREPLCTTGPPCMRSTFFVTRRPF